MMLKVFVGSFALLCFLGCKENLNQEFQKVELKGSKDAIVSRDSLTVADTSSDSITKTARTVMHGTAGHSAKWSSSWMDIETPVTFRRGDTLLIFLSGHAKRIIVRLLDNESDPNSPIGIIGEYQQAGLNDSLVIPLQNDFERIIQVSIHYGENPWGLYSLGSGNGEARIKSIVHLKN